MEEFSFVPDEGLYYEGHIVALFDVYVSRTIEVEHADEVTCKETFYEVVAVTSEGERLQPIVVKGLDNIQYFRNWPEIPDATLTKKQRNLLTLRLQKSVMSAEIVRRIVCNKVGFITHDAQKVLVVGDTCFGEISKPIELSSVIKRYRWRCNTTNVSHHLNTLKDMMGVAPKCSEILTAILLAAAMKPFFLEAGYPLEFCINVYGKSGTYKTSLVKAIMDVTQNPELLVASILNETKKSLLDKVKAGFGFGVILDDYHPAAKDYDRQKQIANMDAVARQMGGNAQTALVILTSEYIDGCYSLQDRMLQLEMQPVDLKLLSKLQGENYLIAQMVKDFLTALVKDYDEVVVFIRQQFECGKLIRDEVSARLARNGHYLMVVSRLCEKYLFDGEEVLTGELEVALHHQADIQKKHLASIRKYEETTDFVLALNEILEAGDIWEICTSAKGTYKGQNSQVCIKNHMMYMTKTALRYGFNKYYGVQKVEIGKIIKALHENDILLEDEDAVTKKFQGTRHLCISYYALAQYVAAENGENASERLKTLKEV